MRDLVESRNGEVIGEKYVPMLASDDEVKVVVADIVAREPDVVFATIVGQSARRFYRMYSDAGIDRRRRPVASLTMVEGEVAAIGAEYCDGHIASATYFSTLDQPGKSILRAKIPRALRRECAGQHVVGNGVFSGPSVCQSAARSRHHGDRATRRSRDRPVV